MVVGWLVAWASIDATDVPWTATIGLRATACLIDMRAVTRTRSVATASTTFKGRACGCLCRMRRPLGTPPRGLI